MTVANNNNSMHGIKTHEEWMDVALDLAKRGEGKVPGRPLVGCVIVNSDNKKIGDVFLVKWRTTRRSQGYQKGWREC